MGARWTKRYSTEIHVVDMTFLSTKKETDTPEDSSVNTEVANKTMPKKTMIYHFKLKILKLGSRTHKFIFTFSFKFDAVNYYKQYCSLYY